MYRRTELSLNDHLVGALNNIHELDESNMRQYVSPIYDRCAWTNPLPGISD